MFIYVDAPYEEVRHLIRRWEYAMDNFAPFGERATHFLAVVDVNGVEVDAGYAQAFRRDGGVYSLAVAWVEPWCRSMGLWGALVTKRLEWCAANGGTKAVVSVDPDESWKLDPLTALGGIHRPALKCVEFLL